MSECDPETVEPTITVTFSWGVDSELALGPDCPDDDEAGLWWNVLVLPDWAFRYTQAPPSAWVPGNVLLAATPDSSALTLVVAALGTDTTTLEAQKDLLEAALSQWPFVVTIEVGEGAGAVTVGSWRADPTIPHWGAMTPQQSGLFAAEGAVSIPLNPVGAP